jgi:hypothetical protein
MQVRKVNYCFLYGNGNILEGECESDQFNRVHAHKLKSKDIVGYFKEYQDTESISFFVKNCEGEPIDYFRIKEYGYYDSRLWKYSKVSKECFSSFVNYLTKIDDFEPGSRKFILKRIKQEILK